MRTFSIHQVRNVLIAIAVVVLIGATYLASSTPLRAPSAEAGTGENITGWAWSENVGWISLNSISDGSATSYGVNVDVTNKITGGMGNFSGYAWSENVGWITFNAAQLTGCPSGTCVGQVNWSTGNVTGWAKVLSTGGGWDGWIKLSDDSIPAWDGKGLKISGNKFTGYAYGGDVMGWIDFAPLINGTIPIGAEVSAPPCETTDPTIVYGSCQATGDCAILGEGTYTNQSGVQVGMCETGGTTVVSCTGATLICPSTTPPTATTTRWWQF